MARKRSTQHVITDILLACQGMGTSRTKVVYASGLNFKAAKPYLEGLSADGLLEIVPGEVNLFRITPKGIDALGHLKAISELMPSFISEGT